MHATTTNAPGQPTSFGSTSYVMTVGDQLCTVRVTPVSPISEVLEFEDEFGMIDAIDARMVVDLLDSRMIAPPRPRRRRDRAVSSRAVFYAAGH